MTGQLDCWKCGATLDALPLPLSRLATCPQCNAWLHVCRLCAFFDPQKVRTCREPDAEEVSDKERSNFCGYFKPRPGAYRSGSGAKAKNSRAQLDALFGAPAAAGENQNIDRSPLDDLFEPGDKGKK